MGLKEKDERKRGDRAFKAHLVVRLNRHLYGAQYKLNFVDVIERLTVLIICCLHYIRGGLCRDIHNA